MPRALGDALAVGISAVLSVCTAGVARADGGATSALSWVRLPGAESCIATAELGQRVESHLGRVVLVSPSVADVSIEGRAEPVGAGARRRFRVVVEGTRKDGSRTGVREVVSRGADCRELDDDVVLVVALMIDRDAFAPSRPQAPIAAPSSSPPAPPPEVLVRERVIVRDAPTPPVPARSPWIAEATLGGALAVGRVPGAAPGVVAAFRAGPSRLVAFELSLGVLPGSDLDVGGGRRVRTSVVEGGLAYCPTLPLGARVEVGGCAGVRAGNMRIAGQGFSPDAEADRGLLDALVGARTSIALFGPVLVGATASAVVPIVRQRTTATEGGRTVVLHERSALGAEVVLSAGVRFSP